MTLSAQIEALLFYKGESLTCQEMAKILKVTESDIEEGLRVLTQSLEDRGLTLLQIHNQYTLGTRKEASQILEELRKEELNKELSKASLETLAVILYKGFATRGDIDYIRGVNTSFILRNLLMRGLIEKAVDKDDSRKLVYAPTIKTLQYMGITSLDELTDRDKVIRALEGVIEDTKDDLQEIGESAEQ
ncbi:MAG: segregation and condensation protein [Patescibacteria group bacterium]|jgi:segregation and condensation protein B|nr:segregation and condensation protein [Patescibacteria group bacterium]